MKTILAIAILAAGTMCAQTGKMGHEDESFLKKAVEGNMAEVQMGKLAQTNAENSAVKTFGERMVTDHTKLNDKVKSLAAAQNVTLPAEASIKERFEYKRLEGKKGADFDKAYIELMIKDHKADISEFQKEANSGVNSDVKNLASQALPTLQEHLKLAEDAAKQVGVNTSTTGE
jgi:putative membrane protein